MSSAESSRYELARAVVLFAALIGGVGWYLHDRFKRPDGGRRRVVAKWLLTLAMFFATAVAMPWYGVYGFLVIGFCGVGFAMLWTSTFAGWLMSPLLSAIDGGKTPPALKPLLSPVEAKRKRGHYAEAVAELRGLMEKFPGEFETQMLFAAIHAENLGDLDRARTSIQRLVNQSEHPRNLRAFALTQLADWELSRRHDPESARQCFERIQQLFPDTEHAIIAAQRIAHLPSFDAVPAADSSAAIRLPRNASPELRAEELTRHLGRHPFDAEAREELSTLFAEELGQTNLAVQQLETMIAQPNQPPRKLSRWLNRIADIHIHQNSDESAARATLQRISRMFPGTQFAEMALARQERLSLELRGKQTSREVKLGSYEDDLGLKRGLTSG